MAHAAFGQMLFSSPGTASSHPSLPAVCSDYCCVRFMCLEFSHVPIEPLQKAYDWYSFNVIPTIGQVSLALTFHAICSGRATPQHPPPLRLFWRSFLRSFWQSSRGVDASHCRPGFCNQNVWELKLYVYPSAGGLKKKQTCPVL